MATVTLKAHFDGEQIVLDEPFEIPPNSRLAVTVLSPVETATESEQADWAALATKGLSKAYGDSEPEYTIADLKK